MAIYRNVNVHVMNVSLIRKCKTSSKKVVFFAVNVDVWTCRRLQTATRLV